ncbi:unnamed protein product [Tilletia controversa]|nr:unnamed protein product [Tilletia controversa]
MAEGGDGAASSGPSTSTGGGGVLAPPNLPPTSSSSSSTLSSTQQIVFSSEQFQQLFSSALCAYNKGADKDEGPSFPSFKIDHSSSIGAYKLWFGCPLTIPDHLVRLFNAGSNLPLSLLTVAAIRDFGINQRRSSFHSKMSGKLLDEYNSWHLRDEFLPFPEWSQAILTLIHLFRSVRGPPPEDEDIEQDPIHQLTEHVLHISTRVNSYNWPIFREYDKRIRQLLWAPRPKGVGMPFSISTIHAQTLDDAEVLLHGRSGAAADYGAVLNSAWAAVVSAPPSDIIRVGKRLADLTLPSAAKVSAKDDSSSSKTSTSHSHTPSSSTNNNYGSNANGKRKAEDDGRSQSPQSSFRGPPTAPPLPRSPMFCIICRIVTDRHIWYLCPGPYPQDLYPNPPGQPRGWTRRGQSKDLCAKYNAGVPEPGMLCLHGHYCSQCGRDTCRAIDHGPRENTGAPSSSATVTVAPTPNTTSNPVGFSGAGDAPTAPPAKDN